MNEERNAEILRLWNMDISAKEVGLRLGLTKNVVIGVVTRLREKGLVSRQILKGPEKCGEPENKRLHDGYVKKEPVFKIKPIDMSDNKQDANIIGVSLFDLDANGCRYPTSRVADQHYFCNASKRDRETSYCAKHHALAFRKKRKLTSEDLRVLKQGYAMRQWLKGSNAVGMS